MLQRQIKGLILLIAYLWCEAGRLFCWNSPWSPASAIFSWWRRQHDGPSATDWLLPPWVPLDSNSQLRWVVENGPGMEFNARARGIRIQRCHRSPAQVVAQLLRALSVYQARVVLAKFRTTWILFPGRALCIYVESYSCLRSLDVHTG
jgi:hypothetical protein